MPLAGRGLDRAVAAVFRSALLGILSDLACQKGERVRNYAAGRSAQKTVARVTFDAPCPRPAPRKSGRLAQVVPLELIIRTAFRPRVSSGGTARKTDRSKTRVSAVQLPILTPMLRSRRILPNSRHGIERGACWAPPRVDGKGSSDCSAARVKLSVGMLPTAAIFEFRHQTFPGAAHGVLEKKAPAGQAACLHATRPGAARGSLDAHRGDTDRRRPPHHFL